MIADPDEMSHFEQHVYDFLHMKSSFTLSFGADLIKFPMLLDYL